MTVQPENAYWVSVPPRSSGTEIHAAIADLRDHRREVRLMAGSLRFATPREICGLRALVDHAAERADRVVFDCPIDADVHGYLARMNFYGQLPANVALFALSRNFGPALTVVCGPTLGELGCRTGHLPHRRRLR